MAQLGARLNGIEKVVGSSPTGSTFDSYGCWNFDNQIEFAETGVVSYLSASQESKV